MKDDTSMLDLIDKLGTAGPGPDVFILRFDAFEKERPDLAPDLRKRFVEDFGAEPDWVEFRRKKSSKGFGDYEISNVGVGGWPSEQSAVNSCIE